MHPVFASDTPVARRVLSRGNILATRAPWIHTPAYLAMRSPQFERDRQAFAEDLLRTGQMSEMRAQSLASVAVSEAYLRRIPPALVLGVMLTENEVFKSTARSSVGAVGLMQISGRQWRGALGRKFGTNLRDDATNLRYGIFILSHLVHKVGDNAATPEASWRKALLRYNGCVRGTNTPDCHRYPDVVRRHVERSAKAICRQATFASCVETPLWVSLRAQFQPVRAAD